MGSGVDSGSSWGHGGERRQPSTRSFMPAYLSIYPSDDRQKNLLALSQLTPCSWVLPLVKWTKWGMELNTSLRLGVASGCVIVQDDDFLFFVELLVERISEL